MAIPMITLDSTAIDGFSRALGDGRRLHHLGLVVPSIDRAAGDLERWLDLHEMTLPFRDEAQRVRVQFVHIGAGTFIELIEPAGDNSPILGFLSERGGGLHHLAFETADFDRSLVDATDRGGRLIGKPWLGFEGRRLAFVMPRSGLGLLIELVEARPVVPLD